MLTSFASGSIQVESTETANLDRTNTAGSVYGTIAAVTVASPGRIQDGIDLAGDGATVTIAGGTITGDVVTADKAVTLSIGAEAAQVTIVGNMTLGSDDAVVVQIEGLAAGTEHDQLAVQGMVELGGAALSTPGSISADLGETVTIIERNKRRTPSLKSVLESEGLPEPSPLTQGEERMLDQTGTRGYYESLQQESVRPRRGAVDEPQPDPVLAAWNEDRPSSDAVSPEFDERKRPQPDSPKKRAGQKKKEGADARRRTAHS